MCRFNCNPLGLIVTVILELVTMGVYSNFLKQDGGGNKKNWNCRPYLE